MNKKISFKHITGSMKIIPGVDDRDLAPRLVQKFITHPEAGAKPFPIQELVAGHIVHIVLVNEDYEPLTEEEKELPPSVRDHIEKARAEDMLRRRDANRQVRSVLQRLSRDNEIELFPESELTAEEVVNTKYPIVSLSEIAQADWESQGKAIPPELSGKQDTERIRAAAAIAREAKETKETKVTNADKK